MFFFSLKTKLIFLHATRKYRTCVISLSHLIMHVEKEDPPIDIGVYENKILFFFKYTFLYVYTLFYLWRKKGALIFTFTDNDAYSAFLLIRCRYPLTSARRKIHRYEECDVCKWTRKAKFITQLSLNLYKYVELVLF